MQRPGLYELPFGTSLDELVFEHAGGVPGGRRVKAVIPGGLSAPALPAGQLDVSLSEEALRERGSRLGSGAVVVMDETTCMVRVACVASGFHRRESCGVCAQCREGTAWLDKLFHRIERGVGEPGDLAILDDLAQRLEEQARCGFSSDAAGPVRGLLRHFRDEFTSHVLEGRCPYPGSFEL